MATNTIRDSVDKTLKPVWRRRKRSSWHEGVGATLIVAAIIVDGRMGNKR